MSLIIVFTGNNSVCGCLTLVFGGFFIKSDLLIFHFPLSLKSLLLVNISILLFLPQISCRVQLIACIIDIMPEFFFYE